MVKVNMNFPNKKNTWINSYWIKVCVGFALFPAAFIYRTIRGFLSEGSYSVKVLVIHSVPPKLIPKYEKLVYKLRQHFDILTPDEFSLYADGGLSLKRNSVLITFDDAFLSQKVFVDKVLVKYGIKAVFFIPTDFVNTRYDGCEADYIKNNLLVKEEPMCSSMQPMSWGDLKELSSQGHAMGSHSKSHPVLANVKNRVALNDEIIDSKRIIEDRLDCSVRHFAFPFGKAEHFSTACLEIAREHYDFIHTTIWGENSRPSMRDYKGIVFRYGADLSMTGIQYCLSIFSGFFDDKYKACKLKLINHVKQTQNTGRAGIITQNSKALIGSVYSPPELRKKKFCFRSFLHGNSPDYFNYGRHALCYALKKLKIGSGDMILMPSYICRDVLSSVNSLGIVVVYYSVNQELKLNNELPLPLGAKAIIAVNYFGFPQELQPFYDYCKRNSAYLIEDNCHGFLSCDVNGKPLGLRGDVGLFSFRKTIVAEKGAAVIFPNSQDQVKTNFEFEKRVNIRYTTQAILRKSVSIFGIIPIRIFTRYVRLLRWLRSGSVMPKSDPDSETVLPSDTAFPRNFFKVIEKVDSCQEAQRRRDLFFFVSKILDDCNISPVFSQLPNYTVPYAYPFYCEVNNITSVKKRLAKYSLECFLWPDLPAAVVGSAPDYYKSLWLVRFLW